MTKQSDLWKGIFGSEYIQRNIVTDEDIHNRKQTWSHFIHIMAQANNGDAPMSFVEFGAGQGQNLIAIDELYTGKKPRLAAVEVNYEACKTLKRANENFNVINSSIENLKIDKPIADVAFTSGVLIHVHPDNLKAAMDKVYKASANFIVCMEYFSPEQRQINYRGQNEALWANDFGSLYLDNYGVRCLGVYFHWKRLTGLDNLTSFIFQKVN